MPTKQLWAQKGAAIHTINLSYQHALCINAVHYFADVNLFSLSLHLLSPWKSLKIYNIHDLSDGMCFLVGFSKSQKKQLAKLLLAYFTWWLVCLVLDLPGFSRWEAWSTKAIRRQRKGLYWNKVNCGLPQNRSNTFVSAEERIQQLFCTLA